MDEKAEMTFKTQLYCSSYGDCDYCPSFSKCEDHMEDCMRLLAKDALALLKKKETRIIELENRIVCATVIET